MTFGLLRPFPTGRPELNYLIGFLKKLSIPEINTL